MVENLPGKPGKGRGVVARRALSAGTLLMACRAFVSTPANTERGTTFEFSAKDTPRGVSVTRNLLVQIAVRELLDHPERSAELYLLSGGARFDGSPFPGYWPC